AAAFVAQASLAAGTPPPSNTAKPAATQPAANVVAQPAMAGTETFVLDRAHSYIGFQVRHFVSKVPGKFDSFTGSVSWDPKNPSTMQLVADIDATSIDTDNDKRDNHL